MMSSRWVVCTAAVGVGLALGFALGRVAPDRSFHGRWNSRDRYARLLDKFSSRLRMTSEQRERVGALLEEKRQKMQALKEEVRPRFDALRASTREEIRRILTGEQQEVFDRMQAEWEARREKWRRW